MEKGRRKGEGMRLQWKEDKKGREESKRKSEVHVLTKDKEKRQERMGKRAGRRKGKGYRKE